MRALGPMRWRHPSRAALRRWLQGEADEPTDAHIATCERCAARLETLAGESDPGGSIGTDALQGVGRASGLRAALEAALKAPNDDSLSFSAIPPDSPPDAPPELPPDSPPESPPAPPAACQKARIRHSRGYRLAFC